jgi:CBS domain-containing protein
MKVRNLLASKSGKVITVNRNQTVKDVVDILAQRRIGALIVVGDEGKITGIISERDVVRLLSAHGGSAMDLVVGDVMTKDVIIGTPQDDVLSVAHTMTERRFRHLPILEGDDLIAMISIGDVMKAQRDAYRGEIDTLQTHILAE